jgi:uncharacterized UPF0160 family protein
MTQHYIVGHVSVDGDCLGALWLLKRYGGERFIHAAIKLVHTGSPNEDVLANALADTGKIYDPATLRFDHHLEGEFYSDKSATLLVWRWLREQAELQAALGNDYSQPQLLDDLFPLVDLINRGDLGSKDLDIKTSRTTGLHAMISGLKYMLQQNQRYDDLYVIELVFGWFDVIAATLTTQATARRELMAKTRRFSGRDGLLLWLDQASSSASHIAMEDGAKAIFFTSYEQDSNGQMTYPRGIQVDPAYIGADKIVALAIEICDNNRWPDAAAELRSWFIHPQRFFAGKGTRKAPCHTALAPWDEDTLWIAIAQAFNPLHRETQEPVSCE